MAFSTSKVIIGHTTKKSDADRLMDNTIALASADFSFHGEKTFHSSTVFKMDAKFSSTVSFEKTATYLTRPRLDGIKSRTSTSGVEIEAGKILQNDTATVTSMAMKVFEIGDWNMQGTAAVDITHGLTLANIRNIAVTIRHDDNNIYYHLDVDGYWEAKTTVVTLTRTGGGFFDSIAFNATSYNRGWITLIYEV